MDDNEQTVEHAEVGIYEYVAGQIRQLRLTHEITQGEFGYAVGVNNVEVSRWENGTSKPSLIDLQNIARMFDVALTSLLPPDKPFVDTDSLRYRMFEHLLTKGPKPREYALFELCQRFNVLPSVLNNEREQDIDDILTMLDVEQIVAERKYAEAIQRLLE